MAVEQDIHDLESRRYKAMIESDVAALEELLADEMIYTHSSSAVDDKASYVNGFRTGKWNYRKVERPIEKVTVFGDTACVAGHVHITVGPPGGPERVINSRFLDVWVRRSGKWQMVAWQATPIPAK